MLNNRYYHTGVVVTTTTQIDLVESSRGITYYFTTFHMIQEYISGKVQISQANFEVSYRIQLIYALQKLSEYVKSRGVTRGGRRVRTTSPPFTLFVPL